MTRPTLFEYRDRFSKSMPSHHTETSVTAPLDRKCPRVPIMLLLAVVVCSSLSGCVFRRMRIESDPPGALVMLDGKEVGYTPYTADFTYYATREIKLIKPGYKTLTTLQRFSTPWYQYPGIDFFSENLSPFKVTNRQRFKYKLEPRVIANNESLQERANNHRSQAQLGGR